jgi:DNA-binding transcriptional ArsR family regulator
MPRIESAFQERGDPVDEYWQDPVWQDFLVATERLRLSYSDVYRVRKYAESPEENRPTLFTKDQISYLANRLRLLHRFLRRGNWCRLFLALRQNDNCCSLSRRLGMARSSIQHWLNYLLDSQLLRVCDFGDGNEVLFERNRSGDMDLIVVLLDRLSEERLRRMARV